MPSATDRRIDTYARTDPNVVHVLPVDDLVEHRARGFACVCGPKVQLVECCGWVVTHQALDGRS